jgi:uncharacterized delta-60 repeat protein
LLPNGTLDATFGIAQPETAPGVIITPIGAERSFSIASGIALQPDGKIVVAGITAPEGGHYTLALVRYNPNGTLDASTFGDGGMVIEHFAPSEADVTALALQPRDGRIVVAGSITDSADNKDFFLTRYHAFTCNKVVVTQVGTAGDDLIVGTSRPDVIFGFGGDDDIRGLGGNDILCGGSGNDILRGGSRDDILIGGSGTDTCNGGAHVNGDTASGCETVTNVP